jgi:hypothetical protein
MKQNSVIARQQFLEETASIMASRMRTSDEKALKAISCMYEGKIYNKLNLEYLKARLAKKE